MEASMFRVIFSGALRREALNDGTFGTRRAENELPVAHILPVESYGRQSK